MASTLAQTLQASPHDFLTPSSSLHADALAQIASALQPVASSVQALHEQRTAEHRRKRKRGHGYEEESALQPWDERQALRLGRVHVNGFAVEQVWEQVRRVVEGIGREVNRDLEIRAERRKDTSDEEQSQLGEEGLDYEVEGVDDDEDARPSDDESEEDMELGSEEEDDEELLDEDEELDLDDEGSEEDEEEEETQTAEYVQDANGLNDGFFSIDDFNKQSAFLEQADARGDNDGAASDEEEVDWNVDPMNAGAEALGKPSKSDPAHNEESDDEDGPTFGNMDLDAPEGESDEEGELEGGEMDDLDDLGNANNLMYADFFAPPAKKARPNKKGRPHPHNFPKKAGAANEDAEEDEEEGYNDGALSRVHRDLFSDDEEEDLSSGEDNDEELPPSKKNLSSHERRQLALNKEISALEATLVSKKPWALSGEASSSSRPLNSLLEEDLAFERTGKPVPVVTAEVSADLETLIKSRILALDFQDLIRRRPDDLAVPGRTRDAFELSDAKSKKSLAQLYEEDHVKQTSGAEAGEQLSEQQKKDQTELVNLWSEIRAQLDSLSNFSLRPKAPTVSLEIRSDVAAAQMEDARPGAAGAEAEVSRLAPTEVYRAGAGVAKEDGEVLLGGRRGEVLAREEMERGQGKRARRRAKVRAKKRAENEPVKKKTGKQREGEKEVLGQLKKGGVKVIGRKGEVTDVEGNKVGAAREVGAGAWKL